MPALVTQKSINHAKDLPFCYFCGEPFTELNPNCPDHIPPEAIFNLKDRDFPLKVASHLKCNNAQSKNDEVIGQLISVIHGKLLKAENVRFDHQTYFIDNFKEPVFAVKNVDIIGQIWRWIRGFHAALYEEFLPNNLHLAIHPPMPHGILKHDGFTIDKILIQQYLFVKIIKINRSVQYIDKIVCNNGKCKYECVWVRMDNMSWVCIFALQIYDWKMLADKHFPSRGCVGFYQPKTGRPINGTKGTELEVPIRNLEPLDPFGK